jgi:hypothetical protein
LFISDHKDNKAWHNSSNTPQCSEQSSGSSHHATHAPTFDTTRDVIEDVENKAIEPGFFHTKIHVPADFLTSFSLSQGSFESIIYQAIKIEYDGFSSNSTSASASAASNASNNKPYAQPSTSRDLNDCERAKLNELIVANKALDAPVEQDLSSFISDNCGIRVIVFDWFFFFF